MPGGFPALTLLAFSLAPFGVALVTHFSGPWRRPLLKKIVLWPLRTVRAKMPSVAIAFSPILGGHRIDSIVCLGAVKRISTSLK